jgi:hypothetical protein
MHAAAKEKKVQRCACFCSFLHREKLASFHIRRAKIGKTVGHIRTAGMRPSLACARHAWRVCAACVAPPPLRARLFTASAAARATRSELAAQRAAAAAPFSELTSALFARVLAGVQPVAAANAGFSAAREARAGGDALRLRCGAASFDVVADTASRTVSFVAAKSGAQATYALGTGARAGEWVCTRDGHLLVEALARELVYHCKAFPDF